MISETNPIGLNGIEFIEFTSPKPKQLDLLFKEFGFSKTMKHHEKEINYYNQNDIHFLVNREPNSFAEGFMQLHGPSICSMGWRVENATIAFATAVERGAMPASQMDFTTSDGDSIPAIRGIGGSLIYLIEGSERPGFYEEIGFKKLETPELTTEKGFQRIDHLTNNVPQGKMETWSSFYKDIFGFTEVRYFDIKGIKTGLVSYALRSPCGKFCIPINEGTEEKSQINEYLEEYKGAGVQHLAFATNDIISSLRALQGSSVETLDIDDQYYQEVFDRVPNVTEDRKTLQDLQILVDGDEEGYLLQIFTKNIIGPIFIEIIQRKNHLAFGEGNFGALFRSIEREQEKRGYLK